MKKRVGGRMGGLGGRKPPCALAATEWRPQAVPVATKEATGIDSRDTGVSFPPKEQFKETPCNKKGPPRGRSFSFPGVIVARP